MNLLMSDIENSESQKLPDSNLKEIEIEIGAVYPMLNQYSPMKVFIREVRVRKPGQTEDQLYAEAVENLSNRFSQLVTKQAENYFKESDKLKQ